MAEIVAAAGNSALAYAPLFLELAKKMNKVWGTFKHGDMWRRGEFKYLAVMLSPSRLKASGVRVEFKVRGC